MKRWHARDDGLNPFTTWRAWLAGAVLAMASIVSAAPSNAPQMASAPAPERRASNPDTAAASPAVPSANAWEALSHAVGDAACRRDAQCRTLAVGHKACGGPEAYLPWSTQHTRAETLAPLAARYQQLRQAEVEGRGLRSNCAVTPDPGARCQDRHCVLATPVGAAPIR